MSRTVHWHKHPETARKRNRRYKRKYYELETESTPRPTMLRTLTAFTQQFGQHTVKVVYDIDLYTGQQHGALRYAK